MQKPSGLARSLTAWVGLILSMMVSASLFGTVALMATERSCLLSLECWRGSPPLALFAAGVTGSVTAVVGPLFLAFLPSVLQPRFPFFRRGFWIFAIAPNSPFFAFYLFETMVDLRGGASIQASWEFIRSS